VIAPVPVERARDIPEFVQELCNSGCPQLLVLHGSRPFRGVGSQWCEGQKRANRPSCFGILARW